MNKTRTSKESKKETNLTQTQKIRSKLSIKADNLKESLKDQNNDEIKNVKLLKIKNRIESGYYELKDVKSDLLDSLINKIFKDKSTQ